MREDMQLAEQKLYAIFEQFAQPPPIDNSKSDVNNDEEHEEKINAATKESLEAYFNERFNQLKKALTSKRRVNRSTDDTDETDDGIKKKKKTNKRKPFRFDTRFYCWSCGAGNHPSSKCKKKKRGHKVEATFTNMMGGCTDFCQVVPKS